MEVLIDRNMEKIQKYAERITTRSLCHASVPGWRSRAHTGMVYLYRHMSRLTEEQLSICIDACHKYMISFNNSTGGFYSQWEDMKAEFEEHLEERQEVGEDAPKCVPHNDAHNVFTDNDGILVPIQNRCIPVNCKHCKHHGYLYANKPGDNTYSSAYRCGNIIAGRYGLLISGGLLCKYSERPDWSK